MNFFNHCRFSVDSSKIKKDLGITFTPIEKFLKDAGDSLIQFGFIKH